MSYKRIFIQPNRRFTIQCSQFVTIAICLIAFSGIASINTMNALDEDMISHMYKDLNISRRLSSFKSITEPHSLKIAPEDFINNIKDNTGYYMMTYYANNQCDGEVTFAEAYSTGSCMKTGDTKSAIINCVAQGDSLLIYQFSNK